MYFSVKYRDSSSQIFRMRITSILLVILTPLDGVIPYSPPGFQPIDIKINVNGYFAYNFKALIYKKLT